MIGTPFETKKIFVGDRVVSKAFYGDRLMWQEDLPVFYTRIGGITFDGDIYYITEQELTGADTLKFTYEATGSAGCNVIGSYKSTASSSHNRSFYHAGSAYIRYYNGLYRASFNYNTKYEVSFGPTSFVANGTTKASWATKTYACEDPMYIGMLPNSASASLTGSFYGNIEVVGKAVFIPCIRNIDNAIGYYDMARQTFLSKQGTGTPVAIPL